MYLSIFIYIYTIYSVFVLVLALVEKQRWEESERREEWKREDERRERVRRKKMQVGEKVAVHCVLPMICGSGGSKSRLAKAAGAEPSGQMRDEKLHAVVARSTFASEKAKDTSCSEHSWNLRCRKSTRPLRCQAHVQVKMYKAHQVRSTFWSCNIEKVHAVVARSTFPSQNVQSIPFSEHFWKLRSRKSARRCGVCFCRNARKKPQQRENATATKNAANQNHGCWELLG